MEIIIFLRNSGVTDFSEYTTDTLRDAAWSNSLKILRVLKFKGVSFHCLYDDFPRTSKLDKAGIHAKPSTIIPLLF